MNRSPKFGNIDEDYFRVISRPGEAPLMEALSRRRRSRAERLAAGLALRQRVPRSSHAKYRPAPNRLKPVERIVAQNAALLPNLVSLRMARMSATPFAFLRGTAAVMAADLAATPATGLQVMACGDMHLANFGLFASAERNLVFGINDFDEVHPGAWEWDLKRLAASAAVAVTFAGGDRVRGEGAAQAAVRSYIRQMRRYSEMGFLETWCDSIDEQDILGATPGRMMKNLVAALAKARSKDRHKSFSELTETVEGQRRIVESLPLVVRETHLPDGRPIIEGLEGVLRSYLRSLPQDRTRLISRYRVADVARKVVGVGSVGTSCWVVLMEGLDSGDPLLLQVKEAGESVLAPYAAAALPIHNQGQRVVFGQRMIQGSPDIFLGWGPEEGSGGKGDFYVRQLADMKGGRKFIAGDRGTLDGLEAYCGLCGWALALAHAKSGDPAIIAGYCGRSDALPDAIGKFATAYEGQTERDHSDLVAAIRQGRLPASAEG